MEDTCASVDYQAPICAYDRVEVKGPRSGSDEVLWRQKEGAVKKSRIWRVKSGSGKSERLDRGRVDLGDGSNKSGRKKRKERRCWSGGKELGADGRKL